MVNGMPRVSKKTFMEKAERLSNSRPLDVQKISSYPQVKAVMDQLFSELEKDGKVNLRNADKLKRHLQTLILDLYNAHCYDSRMYISYSRNKMKYLPGTRLHKLFIRYSMVVMVTDFLIQHGYIEHEKHRHAKEGSGMRSYQSRMRATTKLIDLIESKGIVPGMVESEPDDTKLVILRGPKVEKGKPAPEIAYQDTPETLLMKDNLKLINANNRKHAILLYMPDTDIKSLSQRMNKDPDREPLDFTRKNLRRVFSNGSWRQGGRFYGGWWQGVPREFREFIRINDKDVVECDFSGMHINMLYAWEKLLVPEGDVYHLDGYSKNKTFRDFVKRLLLIMVNAENRDKARKAIQKEVVYEKKLRLPEEVKSTAGNDLFPLMDALAQKHTAISQYFCTGKGIDLQYYDSVIAEKVMLHFARMARAILPLHDSFIMHHGLELELQEAMNGAFRDLFGVDSKVDIKYRSMQRRHERNQSMEDDDGPCDLSFEEMLGLEKPYSIYYGYLKQHWKNRP
jgi:hypothetical protein